MDIVLFIIWLGIMCLLGVKIYLAHQSLRKQKEPEEA